MKLNEKSRVPDVAVIAIPPIVLLNEPPGVLPGGATCSERLIRHSRLRGFSSPSRDGLRSLIQNGFGSPWRRRQ